MPLWAIVVTTAVTTATALGALLLFAVRSGATFRGLVDRVARHERDLARIGELVTRLESEFRERERVIGRAIEAERVVRSSLITRVAVLEAQGPQAANSDQAAHHS